MSALPTEPPDAYRALDGSTVRIPPPPPLEGGPMPVFGPKDREWLKKLIGFRDRAIAHDRASHERIPEDFAPEDLPDGMHDRMQSFQRASRKRMEDHLARIDAREKRCEALYGPDGLGFLDALSDGSALEDFWGALNTLLYQRIPLMEYCADTEMKIVADLLLRFPERVRLPILAERADARLEHREWEHVQALMTFYLKSERADLRHLERGAAKPEAESDLSDAQRKAMAEGALGLVSGFAAFKRLASGMEELDAQDDAGIERAIETADLLRKIGPNPLMEDAVELVEEMFREMVPARTHEAGQTQSEINLNKMHGVAGALGASMPGHAEGEFLRLALSRMPEGFQRMNLTHYPQRMVWPYIASHLDILDRAFGLAEPFWFEPRLERSKAVEVLGLLPKLPARYAEVLVEVATGPAAGGRADAQRLLTGASSLVPAVAARLDDRKATIREQAARTLRAIGDPSALPALKTRQARESARRVIAALNNAIGALSDSGGMTLDDILAEQRADKTIELTEKTRWVARLQCPETLTLSDGRRAHAEFTEWLLRLAVRHGSPAGSAHLDQRLDALSPESRTRFAEWVVNEWIRHDTRPWPEEKVAEAHETAFRESYDTYLMFWDVREAMDLSRSPEYCRKAPYSAAEWRKVKAKDIAERARTFMNWQRYLFSAIDAKGLLAISRHAPPKTLLSAVRGYLARHGKRTSQSKALMDCIAGIEGGRALLEKVARTQKQKSLRAHAEKLLRP